MSSDHTNTFTKHHTCVGGVPCSNARIFVTCCGKTLVHLHAGEYRLIFKRGRGGWVIANIYQQTLCRFAEAVSKAVTGEA